MPNYYAQLDEEGRVIALSNLSGEVISDLMIPITAEQFNNRQLMRSRYIDGEFHSNIARIHADKSSILSDGSDLVTVEVAVLNAQGELQKEFSKELTLELNGMTGQVPVKNGVAAVTISSDEPGVFLLRTVGLDQDAELKVVVTNGK
ncbi:hypothetical protein ACTHPF_05440 [Paenibacillus sp. SAF-054]|uniref:hypothetical protein n=1 Tax=unclassified Paenibacillus TaxID=185978 RepID=UPI003F7DCCDF